MKQHLWLCLSLAVASTLGCKHTQTTYTPQVGTITSQGFVKQWQADYGQLGEPITELHIIGEKLIAYTKHNQSYWMTAESGSPIAQSQVTAPGHQLLPPVMVGDLLVIPTTASFEMFDKNGQRVSSQQYSRVLTSGAATGTANAGTSNVPSLYIGVSVPGSGRLARLSLTANSVQSEWEAFAAEGVLAAPAVVEENIYFGTNGGLVYGLSSNRAPLWDIPDGAFKCDGPITGDLAADKDGVYVASQDQKLYCLNATTGKIKWSYYAGVPLIAGPEIVGNMILQPLPNGGGMVAINKNEGDPVRKAVWIQPAAQQVLMADDQYIYVRSGSEILALDRADGEIKFHSRRTDLKVFATSPTSKLIYAVTRNNSVLGIRPVTTPGISGELVRGEASGDWVAYVPGASDLN